MPMHTEAHVDDVHFVVDAPLQPAYNIGHIGGAFVVERFDRIHDRFRCNADDTVLSIAGHNGTGNMRSMSVVIVRRQEGLDEVDPEPEPVGQVRMRIIGSGIDNGDFDMGALAMFPYFISSDPPDAIRDAWLSFAVVGLAKNTGSMPGMKLKRTTGSSSTTRSGCLKSSGTEGDTGSVKGMEKPWMSGKGFRFGATSRTAFRTFSIRS